MYFYCIVVSNMFRPVMLPCSGWFLWEQEYSCNYVVSESLHSYDQFTVQPTTSPNSLHYSSPHVSAMHMYLPSTCICYPYDSAIHWHLPFTSICHPHISAIHMYLPSTCICYPHVSVIHMYLSAIYMYLLSTWMCHPHVSICHPHYLPFTCICYPHLSAIHMYLPSTSLHMFQISLTSNILMVIYILFYYSTLSFNHKSNGSQNCAVIQTEANYSCILLSKKPPWVELTQ